MDTNTLALPLAQYRIGSIILVRSKTSVSRIEHREEKKVGCGVCGPLTNPHVNHLLQASRGLPFCTHKSKKGSRRERGNLSILPRSTRKPTFLSFLFP